MGTALNEVDVPKHECAILGRMLEKTAVISHLEVMEIPNLASNLTEDEAFEIKTIAQSLSNWAYIARRLLKLSEAEQITIWNLSCVGKMDIPTSAYIQELVPSAKFRVVDNILFVLGNIEPGFANDLAKQIAYNSNIQTIALGSAGGSVIDALEAGKMIRALKLNTTLTANCYSACPLVFMGGVKRTIWSPYPEIGFHRMYWSNGVAVAPGDDLYFDISNYVSKMGANERFVLASMFSAEPDKMFVPDGNTLCNNNVATWVQRLCFGESY
ncbi:MAG: hypothetical protein COA53_05410 [Rhodobacteraceae bacterium]|nr:MAG: hypothetical protein COA53_05410 [Paracoccaceae bacterium]